MRAAWRLFGFLFIVAVICGVVFWERPLWVLDQQTHLKLCRAGIRGHFVALPEGQIHYLEGPSNGDHAGVPLLLVHGLGGRAEDFAPLMPLLVAAGFHVYALDLLGYGRSDRPAGSDYSVATEERVVQEFMDAEHLEQADVAGWSMGGWISLKLTADSPQRVRRLVVYDSAGIVFDTQVDATLFAPKNPGQIEKLVRAMSPTMKVPPPFVQRDIMRRTAARQWVVERSMAAMKTGRDVVDAQMPSMRPPLLIVWGGQDVLTPVSVGEKMHALDPRSSLVTVEGCGHFGPVECSRVYAAATVRFLEEPNAGSGEQHLSRDGQAVAAKSEKLP